MKSKSLSTRLPIYFMAVAIIPLMILGGLIFNQIDKLVKQQRIGDMMNLIDTKYIHVVDVLDNGKNNAVMFSKASQLSDGLKSYYDSSDPRSLAEADAYLKDLQKSTRLTKKHPFNRAVPSRNRFEEFMLLDREGKVVVATKKNSVGQDLSKDEYFTKGKNGTFVKDAYRDNNGENVFAFAAPVKSNGEFLGIVAAKVPLAFLEQLMTGELGNVTGGKLFFAGYIAGSIDLYIMNKEGYLITQSLKEKNKDTVLKAKGSKLPHERGISNCEGEVVTNVGLKTGCHEAMDIAQSFHGYPAAMSSMYIFDMGWTVVVEERTNEAFAGLFKMERYVVGAAVGALFLAIAIAIFLARRISKPLSAVSVAASSFAEGDYAARAAETNTYDEISVLQKGFNYMGEKLKGAVDELVSANTSLDAAKAEAEKARDALWGEMEIAKQIQTCMLPPIPFISGIKADATMIPADEVGGDYYDVIQGEDGRTWFIVGDVSGHGVTSGLIMMIAQTALNTLIAHKPEISPSELLSEANKVMMENITRLGENHYMTLMAIVHEGNGKFRWAGRHQDILIYRSAERKVDEIVTEGMWLGLMDDISKMAPEGTFEMNEGDSLLLYTDGITEAENEKGVMYDRQLIQAFVESGDKNADEIRKHIIDSVQSYMVKQDDDITLLVVKKVKAEVPAEDALAAAV